MIIHDLYKGLLYALLFCSVWIYLIGLSAGFGFERLINRLAKILSIQ